MLPGAVRRIQRYARRPIQPVTIQELLTRNSAVSDQEHERHARWLQEELPVRLAHRLQDFQNLPHIVVCNARFFEAFRLFSNAFFALAKTEPVSGPRSVAGFARTLNALVRSTDNLVHIMQEGYSELQALLDDLVDLDDFLNQLFGTRIGNRVLAEHFLLVHEAREAGKAGSSTGVVQDCAPGDMVAELATSLCNLSRELYGFAPRVMVEGQCDTVFSFVPEHLRFILQEILKNAIRATVEAHDPLAEGGLPPIAVEVMKGSFDVTLKVSDQGGGIKQEQLDRIWRYGYSSSPHAGPHGAGVSEDSDPLGVMCGQDTATLRQMAGYGFGLPLSRVYAQYLGGDIHIQSMHGYGTDVYLNVNHLGNAHETEADTVHHNRLVAS